VTWNHPTSGMFIWVELPQEMDATELLRFAVETAKVAFSPGSIFYAGDHARGRRCLRLSYTNCPPGRIEEGIGRLGQALRGFRRGELASPARPASAPASLRAIGARR
jgi:2-aminoadipate transaminase